MKNKKNITSRMFKFWWNIDNLDVNLIINDYVHLLNVVKNKSRETSNDYVEDKINGIIDYEKTWNDTGKEW
jgi:hypothetical protein